VVQSVLCQLTFPVGITANRNNLSGRNLHASTLESFIAAERALVSAQIKGWRTDSPWAAWKHIGENTGYGQLLVEENFAAIETLAARLS